MTAPDPIRARLDELAELHAKATPGPWKHEHDDYGDEWWFGGTNEGGQETIGAGEYPHIVTDHDHADDAALIVAAVNALPGLLAVVRAVANLADNLNREAHEWTDGERACQVAAELIRDALAAALTTRDGEAADRG